MLKIFATGHVGRDPETRYAPSGESFVTFSLAVSSGSKAKPRTDWMEISCNGKTAEVVQNYVRKGTKLLIEGIPSVNAYIDKAGKPVGTQKVYMSSMEFIGGKSEDKGDAGDYSAPTAGFNAPGPSLQPDDVPFS